MSFFYTSDGLLQAVEGGENFLAMQKAHVDYLAAVEAARRAALGDADLPQGTFDTFAEAEAYLRAQEAAGHFPQRFDDGTGNFPFILEISSPYNGHGPTVFATAVSETDPNPPLNVDIQPGDQ